jgi:hypothetical protein
VAQEPAGVVAAEGLALPCAALQGHASHGLPSSALVPPAGIAVARGQVDAPLQSALVDGEAPPGGADLAGSAEDVAGPQPPEHLQQHVGRQRCPVPGLRRRRGRVPVISRTAAFAAADGGGNHD